TALATGAGTTQLCHPRKSIIRLARELIAHEVHLARRLPLHAQRSRVHRIPPHVRDDRDTPLLRVRDALLVNLIWVRREQEYFCERNWTPGSLNSLSGKSHRHLPVATIKAKRDF